MVRAKCFSRTAQIDSAGVATFASLPRRPELFFQAEVNHQGGRFFASPMQFTNTKALSATLGVYDVANDPGAISISDLHYFVQDVGEGVLSAVEVYAFDNASDKAFMDKPALDGALRSLKITAPPGAQNIRFDGPGFGARFTREGDLIYDSDAVAPGARSAGVTMLYEIPYRNGKAITRTMAYPVKRWEVILPESELRVTSVGMNDRGLQDAGTTRVRLFAPAQSNLPAGGNMVFDLSGQPRGAPIAGADPRAIGLGFVVVALAVLLAYVLFQRARLLRAQDAAAPETRENLLRQISRLDDEFSAGRITEHAYRKRRERLKAQLRAVWDG